MVLQATGTAISLQDLQTEFGGTNPIGMDEYYTNAVSAYTNGVVGLVATGTAISMDLFYGKAKVAVMKTVTLTTGTFSAPGSPGGWFSYNSPAITMPSDYKTLVSWDLTFYAYKNNTSYGWAYAGIGINGVGGVGVAGATYTAQSIVRYWTNQTTALPAANTSFTCYVSFYTYPNLSNCYFTLTIRYYA